MSDTRSTHAGSAQPEAGPGLFPPVDLVSPQLTVRALLTGMLLGAVLSSCNIYTGLTIGWGLNMSISAVLLSYAFWGALQRTVGTRPWGMLENNINQTACSAAAAVSSAGLVAPIPALTMMTGETWGWGPLAIWVFSVCLVGIVVAIPLRKQLIVVDKLPFPSGIANGEMLREMYAKGAEATARVTTMLGAALIALVVVVLREFQNIFALVLTPFSWLLKFDPSGVRLERVGLPIPSAWLGGFSAKNLTFSLDPSLLMVAVGGLIGFRGCCWLIGGSILAWLVIAPPLLHSTSIRLTVKEPLALLPAEVDPNSDFPPPPGGFAKYEFDARTLTFRGQMTPPERDRKLALSNDPHFQEAVRKLYVRSQLELAAPLAALPEGVDLEGLPLVADTAEGQLRAVGGIDRHTYEQLRAKSDDPAYQKALDQLYALFDYTTTRHIRVSEPLVALPAGFSIPREHGHVLQFDAQRGRLVVQGHLSDEARAAVLAKLAEHEQTSPDAKPLADEFRSALEKLAAHANAPLSPAGVELPASLAGVITIDDDRKRIQARGVLTRADVAALKALVPADDVNHADYAATVDGLYAGSLYRPATPGFGDVVEWLLWPGVTLMVVSSLVSFLFSAPAMLRAFRVKRTKDASAGETEEVSSGWLTLGILAALVLATACQYYIFNIPIWIGALAVLLTFALALVAARVTGETNTTPVGAMGKVTQLIFGIISPGQPAANLMTANITGGAASQCGDLIHDLKTGAMIGASPRRQAIAQIGGALAGALAGSFFYLILIPNPKEQLMTEQWAAPAVATWKAVAELFNVGIAALPDGAGLAMLIAGVAGVLLPVLEKYLPKKAALWVPSPAAVGLAFVINGFNAVSFFIGGTLALVASKLFKTWSARFLVAICAGLVAGESLTNVGIVIGRLPFWGALFGGA